MCASHRDAMPCELAMCGFPPIRIGFQFWSHHFQCVSIFLFWYAHRVNYIFIGLMRCFRQWNKLELAWNASFILAVRVCVIFPEHSHNWKVILENWQLDSMALPKTSMIQKTIKFTVNAMHDQSRLTKIVIKFSAKTIEVLLACTTQRSILSAINTQTAVQQHFAYALIL